MLCGIGFRFNLLGGDVFGRVSDKGSSEDWEQPVGFQTAEYDESIRVLNAHSLIEAASDVEAILVGVSPVPVHSQFLIRWKKPRCRGRLR